MVIEYWASQVEAFNSQVDAITAGLAGQAAGDYGVTGTDGAPPTAAQVTDARGRGPANDTHIPYPKGEPPPGHVRVAAPNPAGLAGPDGDEK